MSEEHSITRLLERVGGGDREAEENLYRLVQDDMREIARRIIRKKTPEGDLDTAVVVDTVFRRLMAEKLLDGSDRRRFFTFVARKMRNYLIDTLRRHGAVSRGGDRLRIEWADEGVDDDKMQARYLEFHLDLNGVLEKLEQKEPATAEVFHLRYSLRMDFHEIAEMVGLATETCRTRWLKALDYLKREMKAYDDDL